MDGATTRPLISKIDGQAGAPTRMPLSPDDFAAACRRIVQHQSGDQAHRSLDELVTMQLGSLGFGEGMKIFLDHVRPYHQGTSE